MLGFSVDKSFCNLPHPACGKTTTRSSGSKTQNHVNITECSHYLLTTSRGYKLNRNGTKTAFPSLKIKCMQTCLFSVTHWCTSKRWFYWWQAVFEELQAEISWLSTLIRLHICWFQHQTQCQVQHHTTIYTNCTNLPAVYCVCFWWKQWRKDTESKIEDLKVRDRQERYTANQTETDRMWQTDK